MDLRTRGFQAGQLIKSGELLWQSAPVRILWGSQFELYAVSRPCQEIGRCRGSEAHSPSDVRARATYGVRMARVLLTGMSGAGKSSLLAAVARLAYTTVDTDYDGWEPPGALWDEPG